MGLLLELRLRRERKIVSDGLNKLVVQHALPGLEMEWLIDKKKRSLILNYTFGVGAYFGKSKNIDGQGASLGVHLTFIKLFKMSDLQAEYEVHTITEAIPDSYEFGIALDGYNECEQYLRGQIPSPFEKLLRSLS